MKWITAFDLGKWAARTTSKALNRTDFRGGHLV